MGKKLHNKKTLEKYFSKYRKNIIGDEETFISPYGEKKIIYADWVASGRLYLPIEKKIINAMGPYVGNTHSSTTITSNLMTTAYIKAKHIIKEHVHANDDDVLLSCGSGMTAAVNKLQRILGLRVPEKLSKYVRLPENQKPIIFITHMEHHSNQTSWLETIGRVEIIQPDKNGDVDLNHFELLLKKYKRTKIKIASVTACSNVTGIETPYHTIAKMIHEAGGYCFVDFAASAPYVEMNMHPKNPLEKLDAIYFSPHKFLGGPGSSGILIFDSALYHNRIPDQPGGGTVSWTNPWREHTYFSDIEEREDGGTPPFLQTIKAALSIKLKEEMGIKNILHREEECLEILFTRLKKIAGVKILASDAEKRLGVISFYIQGLHHFLGVKLLNDRFGIQTRGGCDCAGTYGHYLLHIDKKMSHDLTTKIDEGNLLIKPGWIRLSIHPVMKDEEINFICDAIEDVAKNFKKLSPGLN
jgi:selenocysteine lyase/cysteine desulfurase